jgi:hypothetical protein
MNTVFLLMAEFNTSQIPLENICGKYLAMSAPEAKRKANVQRLPFPVYRGQSQKTPHLVKVEDLAKYIDEQHSKANEDWRKMNNAN